MQVDAGEVSIPGVQPVKLREPDEHLSPSLTGSGG